MKKNSSEKDKEEAGGKGEFSTSFLSLQSMILRGDFVSITAKVLDVAGLILLTQFRVF